MKSFPSAALLPKEETLAAALVGKYPECDGRNTVVAIFDTGVDPGAIGLQKTLDGKPKVLDVIDATGAGDVDTTTKLQLQSDGCLHWGDKKLKLNPEWPASADGDYRVGYLIGYDVFPGPLVTRMKEERREDFDKHQREAMNAVQSQLAAWREKHSETTSDKSARQEKKDLEARRSQLEDMSSKYEDPGPIFNCVVFHDGCDWRAAVTSGEDGDFAGVKALREFHLDHEYGTFSHKSQLNYGVHVYDNGDTLSLVCDSGSHGTHVAGIVAANHPDEPACNGVAPGAQLVSVKIGDARVGGSMETTPALSRAILAAIKHKVDVVNMSFGEYATEHDKGRFVSLAKELVDEHNILFAVSAGNNGPALGTVGAPGGTTGCILGVGAYVSPDMMDTEYSMRRNDLSGIAYTWSSRGPTFDGDVGVDICAPGAAITCVPNWTLNKKQLMNGTSMSSPNCAGNVALLISALKHHSIAYSPHSIRRALQHTAVHVPKVEAFAQGKGLVQVLPAFEHMRKEGNKHDGTREYPLSYDITTSCPVPAGSKARGIFLRDAQDFEHDNAEVTVTVSPSFHKHADPSDKVKFERHLRLSSSARWVDVGEHLALMQGPRAFKVLVDTKHLAPGEHYEEIRAVDADHPEGGDVFFIPVTVIKPEPEAAVTSYKKTLAPGEIYRRFLTPPQGATWCDVTIRRASGDDAEKEVESNSGGKLLMFDTMQFQPFVRQSNSACTKAFFLGPGQDMSFSFDLLGGLTTEFCLAQFWSSLGDSLVHVDIRFHGIVPDQAQVGIVGGVESHQVLVASTVRQEKLSPSVSFNKLVRRLRPSKADISPLSSDRDAYPDERQVYQLCLTYEFSLQEDGKVTPRLPLLNGQLYESPFEGQLSLIFDDKKQYVGAAEALPEPTSLKKGAYVIKSQVRHEDVGKLDKLKQMVLVLEQEVKDIPASVYANQNDAALGAKAMTSAELPVGKYVAAFIGEPASDSIPSAASPGDVLQGKLFFGKKKEGEQGSGRRPGGFDVTYVIPPAADKKEAKPDEPKDERTEATKAEEAVRDLLLQRLNKLAGTKDFDDAYAQLSGQHPTHLPLLQAKVHHLDKETDRETKLSDVVSAAEETLQLIDQNELARFFGTRSEDDAEDKKQQKDKEEAKEVLMDTLARKARAEGDAGEWEKFEQTYTTLKKWADVEDSAYLFVGLLHDRHQDAHGLAVERVRKVMQLDSADRAKVASDETLSKELEKSLEDLQWSHWKQYEATWSRRRLPPSYRRF